MLHTDDDNIVVEIRICFKIKIKVNLAVGFQKLYYQIVLGYGYDNKGSDNYVL